MASLFAGWFVTVLVAVNVAAMVFLCATSRPNQPGFRTPVAVELFGLEFGRVHAWVALSSSLTVWVALGGVEIGLSIWLGIIMASGGAAVLMKPLWATTPTRSAR